VIKKEKKKKKALTLQELSWNEPEVVLERHAAYRFFPISLSWLGRYLLIFLGALGVNILFSEALGYSWNFAYMLAPPLLMLLFLRMVSISKKWAIWSVFFLVVFGGIWLGTEGADAPVELFVDGFTGFWNRLMKLIDAMGYVSLPMLPESQAVSDGKSFFVLSFASTAVLYLFTIKKTRWLPCLVYLVCCCLPPILFFLPVSNLGFSLILAVSVAFLITSLSEKRSEKIFASGFLSLTALLLAGLMVWGPAAQIRGAMDEIPLLHSGVEYLQAVFSQWALEKKAGTADTGELLSPRNASASKRNYKDVKVMDVYSNSEATVYLRTWIGAKYESNQWFIPDSEKAVDGRAEVFTQLTNFYHVIGNLGNDYLPTMGMSGTKIQVVPAVGGELIPIPVEPVGNYFTSSFDDYQLNSDGIWTRNPSDLSPYSVIAYVGQSRGGAAAYRFCQVVDGYRDYLEYERSGKTAPKASQTFADLYEQWSVQHMGLYRLADKNRDFVKNLYHQVFYPSAVDLLIKDLFTYTDIARHFDLSYQPASGQNFSISGKAVSMFDSETGKDRVYRLKDTVTATDGVARIVSEYLRKHYSYSLNPKKAESTEAMEAFLRETGEGYCVQFATAGALVLRRLGITTRYAEGYIAKDFASVTEDNLDYAFSTPVVDSNAHAWVEVWLDSFGWQIYEMTPGFEYENGFNQTLPTENETNTEEIPEEETMETEEETQETLPPVNGGKKEFPWGKLLLASSLLALLAIPSFFLYRFLRSYQKHRKRRNQLLNASREAEKLPEKKKLLIGRRLVSALAPVLEAYGVKQNPGELPGAFSQRAAEILEPLALSLSPLEVFYAMMAEVYAGGMDDDQIRLCGEMLSNLTDGARKQLGWWRWLKCRYWEKIL